MYVNTVASETVEMKNRKLRRQNKRVRKWKDVTEDEYKTFILLIVASVGSACCGKKLWTSDNDVTDAHQLFNRSPDYGRFMSRN